MTAGEWETLKQAQRQATKGGNLAELNRTNKTLFEERERRQKTREQAREQEREKCFLLKYPLSAKNAFCPFCNNYKFIFKENNMEKMTQEKAVLQHLKENGSITSWDAITLFGATRLSAIIYLLRKQGYEIDATDLTVKNRYGNATTVAKYILHE